MLHVKHIHGTPYISDDERIAREADDSDVRSSVLKLLLNPLARESACAQTIRDRNSSAEVWLKSCETSALAEFDKLSLVLQHHRVTLQFSLASTELHAGAKVVAVGAPESEMKPEELRGHLCRIRRVEVATEEGSDASSATTAEDGAGDFYIALPSSDGEMELYGLRAIHFPAQARPPRQCQVSSSNDAFNPRVERCFHGGSKASPKHNYFKCLGDMDEDSESWQGAKGTQIIEEIDLHHLSVQEATEVVDESMDRLMLADTDLRSCKRYLLFIVGKGRHSEKEAQIRPAVTRFLHRRGVRHGYSKQNPSAIWVDVHSIVQPQPTYVEALLEDYGYVGELIHALTSVRQQLSKGTRTHKIACSTQHKCSTYSSVPAAFMLTLTRKGWNDD
jgi:hypothetical protein